jgi:hypothetical protein
MKLVQFSLFGLQSLGPGVGLRFGSQPSCVGIKTQELMAGDRRSKTKDQIRHCKLTAELPKITKTKRAG